MNRMLEFLNESPTSFQAVDTTVALLNDRGFIKLNEFDDFKLECGKAYYVVRNDSSIIAFKIEEDLKDFSFKITASHNDCPSFKLKPKALLKDGKYVRLNTEIYGGPLWTPWFDRPLSIAGRVILKKENGIEIRHLNIKRDLCLIPSVAIHMNREANSGFKMNPQVDLLPLLGLDQDFELETLIAKELNVEKEAILNFDLYLYPRQKGFIWGDKEAFVSSHHLDDLECAYTSLMAFLDSEACGIQVWACFDNEEVGSLTRQGADSDFLYQVLKNISHSLNFDYTKAIASSLLVSCDNAHAHHPNHPEKSDPSNKVFMNEGIVIKYNANQSYTSDSLSASILAHILTKVGVPYQYFTNRSDARGGGTLGNISNRHVSILSVDIGLATLAMHSPVETGGVLDVEYMIKGLKAFYESHLKVDEKSYTIV